MIGQQTAIGDALGVAVKVLDAGPDSRADKLAILLTDGNDTASQLPPMLAAKLAAEHHVQVHTIAFGDPNSRDNDKVDLALLQRIAKTTGGHAWTAARSGSALDEVWQKIDAITPVQVQSLGWSWHKALYPWPLSTALLLLLTLAVGRYVREKNGMSNVHFIYPWRLTALLLCAALAWLPHSGRSAWHRLLDKPFRSLIIHRRRRLANLLPWLLALGVIALAGPTWQRELPAALTPQSNVMVILQQDPAMYAGDLAPSRHQPDAKQNRRPDAAPARRAFWPRGLQLAGISDHAAYPGPAVL
nr:von Willebrand factor type A domain [Raoultella sp. NCTC 9187]